MSGPLLDQIQKIQKLRNEAIVNAASSGRPCWWERVKTYDIVIDLLLAAPAPAANTEWWITGEKLLRKLAAGFIETGLNGTGLRNDEFVAAHREAIMGIYEHCGKKLLEYLNYVAAHPPEQPPQKVPVTGDLPSGLSGEFVPNSESKKADAAFASHGEQPPQGVLELLKLADDLAHVDPLDDAKVNRKKLLKVQRRLESLAAEGGAIMGEQFGLKQKPGEHRADSHSTSAIPSTAPPQGERKIFHDRLGAYLNTMVADLHIEGKGQYLRDLFGKFEDEAFAARVAASQPLTPAKVHAIFRSVNAKEPFGKSDDFWEEFADQLHAIVLKNHPYNEEQRAASQPQEQALREALTMAQRALLQQNSPSIQSLEALEIINAALAVSKEPR